MKKAAMIEAFKKYQSKIEEANAIYQAALFSDNCDFSAALSAVEFARKNALLAYEKDAREVKKAVALAAILSTVETMTETLDKAKAHTPNQPKPRSSIMNIVTPSPDRLLAAETAAWDAYEVQLAIVQELQDAAVSAGSSVLQAYNAMQWRRNAACNALDAALATARAEYEDAQGRQEDHKKD